MSRRSIVVVMKSMWPLAIGLVTDSLPCNGVVSGAVCYLRDNGGGKR